MSLEERIMQEMKLAMKAKNTIALESLRAIKSVLLLEKSNGKGTEIDTDKEIEVLQRLVKQRKESAKLFLEQNRTDLAKKEEKQAEVIMAFLPKQLSEENIELEVTKIIEKLGASSLKDMGKVMGEASTELKGKASGDLIAKAVKSLLAK